MRVARSDGQTLKCNARMPARGDAGTPPGPLSCLPANGDRSHAWAGGHFANAAHRPYPPGTIGRAEPCTRKQGASSPPCSVLLAFRPQASRHAGRPGGPMSRLPASRIPTSGGAKVPGFLATSGACRLGPLMRRGAEAPCLTEAFTGPREPLFPHSRMPAPMPPGAPGCRASRWRNTSTPCEGHTAAMMAVVVSGRTGFIVSSRWAFPPENWPHQPAQGCGLTNREGNDP